MIIKSAKDKAEYIQTKELKELKYMRFENNRIQNIKKSAKNMRARVSLRFAAPPQRGFLKALYYRPKMPKVHNLSKDTSQNLALCVGLSF